MNMNIHSSQRRHYLNRLKKRLALAAMVLGSSLATLLANELPLRQNFPEEHPGPPYYARFLYLADKPVTPVVFYRVPEEIPADFNLLDFFDIPRALTAAPLTVSGFHIAKDALPPEAPPLLQSVNGNAVPIWFFERALLEAAAADGLLTIAELESIVAAKGVATIYHEMLHPFPRPDGLGGAKVATTVINARGMLSDGRAFALAYQFIDGRVERLSIRTQ